MTAPRFIQIHWLASYPATLLNRDQDGLGKRIPFGGDVRGRISSQCLKRHWRFAGADNHDDAKHNPWALQTLGVAMGERTKEIVERVIMPMALRQMEEFNRAAESPVNVTDELAAATRSSLINEIYGSKAADPKKRQALFFGQPEIGYIAAKAVQALKSGSEAAAVATLKDFFKAERANFSALKDGAGLESAMFGRMVTSDPAANRDAAIHVAHAITVHPIAREMDFMAVVDDLKREDDSADAGAAGVFDMELTSGLYYGYSVIDVPLLCSNLASDKAIAGKVVEHLAHIVAEVSPGAKKGSTAPYAYAELMLIEAGDRQPRTLANAFRKAIPARSNAQFDRTVVAMQDHLSQMDAAFGISGERKFMSIDPNVTMPNAERVTLDALASWAGGKVAA